MRLSKITAIAGVLALAPFAAHAAAMCTGGTDCDVNGDTLDFGSPIAIQDENVEPGDYEAEGFFDIGIGVPGAQAAVDVAFDEAIGGVVPAGFSNLTIEFFQEGTSLGAFLLTNDDGTTTAPALQSFVITFISDAMVDFEIDGVAFVNSGLSLPDYNINLSAIPIPGALPLLLSGLAGLAFATKRKRSKA